MGGGRNVQLSPGKTYSPQEMGSFVDQTSPFSLESLTPGIVSQPENTFDGGSFDYESPFAQEANTANFAEMLRRTNTGDLKEQVGQLAEIPQEGGEQVGLTLPKAERSIPRSGTIFDGFETNRKKQVQELMAREGLSSSEPKPETHGQTLQLGKESVSSVRMSAEAFEAHAAQRTQEILAEMAALQKRKATVAAGSTTLVHTTQVEDKSNQTLVRRAIRSVKESLKRKSAFQIQQTRQAQLARTKGPQGLEGPHEKSSTVQELTFAQTESPHEWHVQGE